jgi:AraC-like DNA-binding protein
MRGRPSVRVHAGQICFLPYGKALVVSDGTKAAASTCTYFDEDEAVDVLPVTNAGGKGALTKVLVGQHVIEWPEKLPNLSLLPEALMLGASKRTHLNKRQLVDVFERNANSAGGGAHLTRVTELLIIDHLRGKLVSRPAIQMTPRADRVEYAVQIITSDPTRKWSLRTLAREAGLSRSIFAARFSDVVGVSPMAFVAERRLRRAAQLLRADGDTVREVANRVGYKSPAAFSRRFTRLFGISPGTYKRNDKNKSSDQDPADWFMLFSH